MVHGTLAHMRNAVLVQMMLLVLAPPALAQGPSCKVAAVPGTDARPPYPPKAQRLGERGTVDVHVTVTPEGAPSNVALAKSSGSEILDEAALANVRSRLWQPRGSCMSARIIMRITYEMTHKAGNPGEDFYIWRW